MEPEAVRALAARAAPDADVRTWRQLMPMLSDTLGMMDASLWIVAAVFRLAAGLGVMNTMLMATWDRMPELGMLRALGTTPTAGSRWTGARSAASRRARARGSGAIVSASCSRPST
jgi:ABC-type lipoprotein release transport system permease subunit